MTNQETIRIIKEWIEMEDSVFAQDGISGDDKFWYPRPVTQIGRESEKAQMIQVHCYDKNSNNEMMKGEYFSHSMNGQSVIVDIWMPKKCLRNSGVGNIQAPYGLIKQNLLKKVEELSK